MGINKNTCWVLMAGSKVIHIKVLRTAIALVCVCIGSVMLDSLLPHVCVCMTVCSLLGSSVHGIFQARILKWVAIS